MVVFENLMSFFGQLVTVRLEDGQLGVNASCNLSDAQEVLDILDTLRPVLSPEQCEELDMSRLYFNNVIAPAVRRVRIRAAVQLRKEAVFA